MCIYIYIYLWRPCSGWRVLPFWRQLSAHSLDQRLTTNLLSPADVPTC